MKAAQSQHLKCDDLRCPDWVGLGHRCGSALSPLHLDKRTPIIAAPTVGLYGWLVLGVLILAGSKIIWWATDRAWDKFS